MKRFEVVTTAGCRDMACHVRREMSRKMFSPASLGDAADMASHASTTCGCNSLLKNPPDAPPNSSSALHPKKLVLLLGATRVVPVNLCQ